MNLRVRIYMILTALIMITLTGGLVMVWYTYRMERLLTDVIDEDVAAFQAAESLESSLVNQKGFVSYYFLDGNPDWLRQLEVYRQQFRDRIAQTRSLVTDVHQKEAIEKIESEYGRYISSKDRVIAYYKAGKREEGAELHRKVREYFSKIFDLCETFKNIHADRIREAREKSREEAGKLRMIAAFATVANFFLGLLLAFVLVNHILGPVRKLLLEADRKESLYPAGDEIKALSRSVRGLIQDVDYTHSELEKSREHLLQAEKMAMVGQLAAGMAHSVRNPFTSVKMRLFSLSRFLDLSDSQKEDFEVISEEIRHIDTIIQNFLEFSRPPKLKMQRVSPSSVVDMAIQLLEHRVKSYNVNIRVVRRQTLPSIEADPEQLKEVFVNFIMNACEAMEKDGSIVIHEEETVAESGSRVVVIRVSDNGPGIPESVRKKIFQPFFTTKEEGTGLGLSIVSRIIEEHRGHVYAESKEGEGATFVVRLPVMALKLKSDKE
ncbi:MAG: histidine kinase [Desulfobacteraceae bacterium IS3]|nr:MAG: histidine kinase [Desulfobacteraceae bacterium IS3]